MQDEIERAWLIATQPDAPTEMPRDAQRRVQVEPVQVLLLAAAAFYPRRAATGSDPLERRTGPRTHVPRWPIELA